MTLRNVMNAQKLDELDAAYKSAIQRPVAYMGTTFQASAASQDVLTKALASGAIPADFGWRDSHNVTVPMSYFGLQGLARAMLEQGWVAFKRLQDRKDAVRAAQTSADVDAVVW